MKWRRRPCGALRKAIGGARRRGDVVGLRIVGRSPALVAAAVTFGGRLPRQASGKPADWIIDAQ